MRGMNRPVRIFVIDRAGQRIRGIRSTRRVILLIATLGGVRCVAPNTKSDARSRREAPVHAVAPAPATSDGSASGGSEQGTAGELRLEEFKESCLRTFDRIGITNVIRPYEGMAVSIRMTLARQVLDDYLITEGRASIDAPGGTTQVELRGRMSFSLSRAGGRIFGDVRTADIEAILGGRKIAEKSLWPGYEGRCPVELARGAGDYRGFIALVIALEAGDVEIPAAFALPCRLSSDRARMVIGGDEPFDPEDLYISEPRKPSGGLLLSNDFVLGTTNELRIVMGPRAAHFVLYGSERLNDRTADFEGCAGWDLDTEHQVVIAAGDLDSEGEATIRIELPDDPALTGSMRCYQALVRSGDRKWSVGPAVVRIVKE